MNTDTLPKNTNQGMNRFEDLATMFLASNQNQQQDSGIETVNVGGSNILVNRKGNTFNDVVAPTLNKIASGYLMMQKMKRKNNFMQSIQNIMGSASAREDKIKAMQDLAMREPETSTLFGLPDILKQVKGEEWKPKTQDEALDFERVKLGIKVESPEKKEQQRGKMLDRATILRKEFNTSQISKDYQTITRAYQGIESAFKLAINKDKKTRIASDQALGVLFQKLLDPSSVVRESEYARTPEGASLMNRLQSIAPQLVKGGLTLKDEDRMALVEMSKKLLDSAQIAFNEQIDRYTQLAKDYEIDFNLILGNIKKIDTSQKVNSKFKTFNVGGQTYQIPLDKVDEFKNDMGLK